MKRKESADFNNLQLGKQLELKGVIRMTAEGPIIVNSKLLSHYEAIALILYLLEDKTGTTYQIDKLLQLSGTKSLVDTRLNEMARRRQVFQPNLNKPAFKLTVDGEKWIERKICSL